MRNFVLSDVCQEEKDWTAKYLAKEAGANDDLINPKTGVLNRKPYALFDVPLQDYVLNREKVSSYSTYFFQALLAKQNIGSATNDGWVFAMILESYRAYAKENGYQYITEDGQVIPMLRLSTDKFFKYHFTYIRGLQDFVVTGVKHNDSGSADFETLFLRNIADEGNAKTVMSILQGALELDAKSASDILRIVTWAEYSGIRVACSAFLRLYNKGTEPRDNAEAMLDKYESFIQKNTYFGMLLKPIYDVIFEHKHNKEIAEEKYQLEQEEICKSLGIKL